jgi:hypothetical protein
MKRRNSCLPLLTIAQILAWADAYFRRTGKWPKPTSGPVWGVPGQTWQGIEMALRFGFRGLPGGSSLAQLLAKERGVRNPARLPRLTRRQILAWADAYFRRTGRWPSHDSGPIAGVPGETWSTVEKALRNGRRGLKGGSSLAKLLAEAGRKPNWSALPPLSVKQILAWAEAYYRRHGKWPHVRSGRVAEAPENSWRMIDRALRAGRRGLPGGTTLARLLLRHRNWLLQTTYVPIRALWVRA